MGEIIAERYALIDFRGENGLSRSYVVEDLLLQRRAFIKVYPQLEEVGLEYLKAVTLARGLEIPGLLLPEETGFADGEEGETLIFALYPEVREPSLERYLSMGFELTGPESLRISRKILECLEGLHDKGFLHLFLHPRNVLYRPGGEVLLKDACLRGDFIPFVLEKLVRPDFSFFSPRLMDGADPAAVDDLFAAGMFFRWLSGYLSRGPEKQVLEHLADHCLSSFDVGSILYSMHDVHLGFSRAGDVGSGEDSPAHKGVPTSRPPYISTSAFFEKDIDERAVFRGSEKKFDDVYPPSHGTRHESNENLSLGFHSTSSEKEVRHVIDASSEPRFSSFWKTLGWRKGKRSPRWDKIRGFTFSFVAVLAALMIGFFPSLRRSGVDSSSSQLLSSAYTQDHQVATSTEVPYGAGNKETDEEPVQSIAQPSGGVSEYGIGFPVSPTPPSDLSNPGEHGESYTVRGGGIAGTSERSPAASDSNEPPVASFTVSPGAGPSPLRVLCDASGSCDPDGRIVSWRWSFGMEGMLVYWMVESQVLPARIPITLTVTDDAGATASETRYVVLY